jgi:hypothetical protein
LPERLFPQRIRLTDRKSVRFVREDVAVKRVAQTILRRHESSAARVAGVRYKRGWRTATAPTSTPPFELKVQLDQISEAVRAVVPQSMWAAIIEKLEQLEQHPEALDVEADSFADDDAYDPTEFIDEDDEF